jgi:hypothetical protein
MNGADGGVEFNEYLPLPHVLAFFDMPVRDELARGRRYDGDLSKPRPHHERNDQRNQSQEQAPLRRGGRRFLNLK